MSMTQVDYSAYEGLKLSLDDGVMTVTLSNPARRNAMTPLMAAELHYIWDDVWRDPEVKVIVLTGDGANFCAGVDIGSVVGASAPATQAAPVHRVSRGARRHMYALLECEKPVLAKVRGAAYGIGVNLALACDMVFASEDATFCDSHVKIGMTAGDGGVLLWPLLVGMNRAKEYLMTGDPVPAPEAERIGLINHCLPSDQLDARVKAMTDKLKALPPHAVNYTKSALNTALRHMTGAAFEASVAYEIYTMGMQDFNEATAAFMQKRKPQFKGQ